MTRVKISFVILAVLLGMSIFSGVLINRKCTDFISRTENIWELYDSGDHDSACERARDFEKAWEGFRKYSSMLINNEKLTEIDRISARVIYLAEGDSEELHSELMELRHMIESLEKGETPVIESIF
ncbi:MAG: DUF4363 family protein [Ruminococcus sp.]|nr:DUF4363 family protein [Ruminococcus sp.]